MTRITKKATEVQLSAIETDENGNMLLNLGATKANDDWIRSARKLKEGKKAEVEKADAVPMVKSA